MKAEFYYSKHKYVCTVIALNSPAGEIQELRIRNTEGEVLAVQQGQKHGLQGKTRIHSKQVDISQPHYFNLVKAAVSALTIAEQLQQIEHKEQIIGDRDAQIQLLNAEIEIFKQKAILSDSEREEINRLRGEVTKLTNHGEKSVITVRNAEQIEMMVRKKVGDRVWQRLELPSRRELCDAYKYKELIEGDIFTAEFSDYKASCMCLGNAIEREVVHTFFKFFYQFLSSNNYDFKIGGLTIKPKGKYTLGTLPPLIARQWDTFKEELLQKEKLSAEERQNLCCKVNDNKVETRDRKLVKSFLRNWQHPLAVWLAQGEVAASRIDQIRKIRNFVSHPEPIHKWQFTELWLLVMGGKTKSGRVEQGILREIYEPV